MHAIKGSPAIASIEPATPPVWDETWRGCDYATYFHGRGWHTAWQTATGSSARADVVRFEDGARALLPESVRVRCGGLVRQHDASPAGTYGGWISRDPLDSRHHAALARHLVASRARLDWRVNPFGPPVPELVAADDATRAVRLDAPVDALLRGWSKGHRAAVRQAERAGVTVRAAASPEDWAHYDAIYRDTVARWGESATANHPRALFDALAAEPADRVTLWLAELAGEPVAGALCLYAPQHVSYWHGAALERAFPARPVHLLVREAVADAIDRGLAWFDFNPSGGHAGVEAFKKSFGTVELPAPVVRRRPAWSRLTRALARAATPPASTSR